MNDYICKGYAKRVDDEESSDGGIVWYLPHHAVTNQKKKNEKTRVVFDCAAKCRRLSLNDTLMQGPNLTNSLVGVLTQFRKEPYALIGDICPHWT